MTEQKRINAEVQTKLALQDAKFNMFMQEMRDFKDEMRQQNKMRVEEIREIRASVSGMMVVAVGAMVATVVISFLRN